MKFIAALALIVALVVAKDVDNKKEEVVHKDKVHEKKHAAKEHRKKKHEQKRAELKEKKGGKHPEKKLV